MRKISLMLSILLLLALVACGKAPKKTTVTGFYFTKSEATIAYSFMVTEWDAEFAAFSANYIDGTTSTNYPNRVIPIVVFDDLRALLEKYHITKNMNQPAEGDPSEESLFLSVEHEDGTSVIIDIAGELPEELAEFTKETTDYLQRYIELYATDEIEIHEMDFSQEMSG